VDRPTWKANGMTIPDPAVQPTVTVEFTGEALGVSRASAYEAVRKGEIPSIKIGRRVVVPTAALRRLLKLDDA
jgi:excisionase family DNA binding protein